MTLHNVAGIPYDLTLEKRYSPIYRSTINQCTLTVPGGGCVYFRANKGDVCPFCAFPIFSRNLIKGPGHANDFSPWTLNGNMYKEMFDRSLADISQAEKLAIFNGGSFFPNPELPEDFQHYIYESLSNQSNIRQLMVESYPNYISEKKIRTAKELLTNTDLMVGIGFESVDNYVRNTLLKKRIDLAIFEKKVKLLQKNNVQVFVYAFLKAPGLSEREALNETLNTIRYLNNLGVNEIAISSAFIPPDTDLENQYHNGEFRPPWLWTILELIEISQKNQWPVSIGGFEDTPPPVAGPHNCPKCDLTISAHIESYRKYGKLISKPSLCSCHKDWAKEFDVFVSDKVLDKDLV